MINYLESQIDLLINKVNDSLKGFGWKNHPHRNHNGTYLNGEPFDYCILTRSKKICFDAKETDKNVWNIKDKDIKQAINLKKCQDAGIDSFFLIYFIKDKNLLKLEIEKFLKIIPDRKHIKQTDCVKWNYREVL